MSLSGANLCGIYKWVRKKNRQYISILNMENKSGYPHPHDPPPYGNTPYGSSGEKIFQNII